MKKHRLEQLLETATSDVAKAGIRKQLTRRIAELPEEDYEKLTSSRTGLQAHNGVEANAAAKPGGAQDPELLRLEWLLERAPSDAARIGLGCK